MINQPAADLDSSSDEWRLHTVGLTTSCTIPGTPRSKIWTQIKQHAPRDVDQRNSRRGITYEVVDGIRYDIEFQVESTKQEQQNTDAPAPRNEIADSIRIKITANSNSAPQNRLQTCRRMLARYETMDILDGKSTLSLTYYYESDSDEPVQRVRLSTAIIELFNNNLRVRGVSRGDFDEASSKLRDYHQQYFSGKV